MKSAQTSPSGDGDPQNESSVLPRSGLPKTVVLLPVAGMSAMAQGTIALGLLFYVRERFGATPTQVGCLAGTWPVAYMLSCTLLRRFSAKLLPRYSLLTATTLLSACLFLLTQVSNLTAVFMLFALQGSLTSLFWPPLMGWLSAGCEGRRLNRTMGHFNLSWSGGAIISPLLAGRLSDLAAVLPIRFGCVLYGVAACAIAAAIILLPSLACDDEVHGEELAARARDDGGDDIRYPAWAGVFTSYLVLAFLISVFPVAARDTLGLSRSSIGTLLFIRALSTSMALGCFGHTEWWHFRGDQLLFCMVLSAAVLVGLAFTSATAAIALLLVLAGLLTAQAYANSLFHGVSGSIRRSSRMAVHETLLSAGLFAGGILGGAVYDVAGMRVLFLLGAGLCAVTAAVQVVLLGSLKGGRGPALQSPGPTL